MPTKKKYGSSNPYFAARAKVAKEIQRKNPGMSWKTALEYATKVLNKK